MVVIIFHHFTILILFSRSCATTTPYASLQGQRNQGRRQIRNNLRKAKHSHCDSAQAEVTKGSRPKLVWMVQRTENRECCIPTAFFSGIPTAIFSVILRRHDRAFGLKVIPSSHSSATWCIMVNASMWCLPTNIHEVQEITRGMI